MTGSSNERSRPPLGRRALLGGAASVSLGAGAAFAIAASHDDQEPKAAPPEAGHQVSGRLAAADHVVRRTRLPQGLDDAVPAFGAVLSLDLTPALSRQDVRSRAQPLLRRLTRLADDAERGLASTTGVDAAGLNLRATNLQVTVGLGASLLRRCDLPHPGGLVDLPGFRTDRLDPALTGGDVLVQIAAEDLMRLSSAVQRLQGLLGGDAHVRWAQQGFRATAAGEQDPAATRRNLMGHRDGTANSPPGSPLWESTVVAREPDTWMDGGSYAVVRLIRIDLDGWFEHPVAERDRVIGRGTATGAPLGERHEDDPVDLGKRDATGRLAVPPHAHVRLAGTRTTDGARIYRRGWNYDNGWTSTGERDAGLLLVAWQADARRGFVPIQRSLVERHDALNAFTTHVGSALFAVPARGHDAYVGQQLLESR